MKIKLNVGFLFAFIVGFIIPLNAQKIYLPVPDSIVMAETEEYEEDTLSVYSVEEKGYYKANPVLLKQIKFLGRTKWSDSTVIKTYYLKGKKHKELTRSVSSREDLNDSYTESAYPFDDSENATQNPYPTSISVYNKEAIFLDSMTVSKGEYEGEGIDQVLNDTIIYCFKNRFFKYSSSFQNERLMSSKRKDYLFDNKGKLTGFVTVHYNLTGTFTCVETVKLVEKDTLTVQRKWENLRHTHTNYMEEEWVYNNEKQIVDFVEKNNGKLNKRMTFSYYPNGDTKTKKTQYEDGREAECLYWWKRETNRLQLWSHIESPFTFERKGEFYHLTDTSVVDGKINVMIYEFEIEGKASDCKPQLLDGRQPLVHSKYDEKNRLVFLATRDLNSGTRKTIVRYKYSK